MWNDTIQYHTNIVYFNNFVGLSCPKCQNNGIHDSIFSLRLKVSLLIVCNLLLLLLLIKKILVYAINLNRLSVKQYQQNTFGLKISNLFQNISIIETSDDLKNSYNSNVLMIFNYQKVA